MLLERKIYFMGSFQNFACKFKHQTGPNESISGALHSCDQQAATLTRVKMRLVPDVKTCILRMSPVLFERCVQLACIPIVADKVGSQLPSSVHKNVSACRR